MRRHRLGTVADELCKVGVTCPGGGPAFSTDYQQHGSFCATEAGGDFTPAWCSDTTTSRRPSNWSNSAIGASRTCTTTVDTTRRSGAVQTAVDDPAPAFNGVAKDDWWLPSVGELMAVHTNLRQAGVGSFSASHYWSSSEYSAADAWTQDFEYGCKDNFSKETATYVRVGPARGF